MTRKEFYGHLKHLDDLIAYSNDIDAIYKNARFNLEHDFPNLRKMFILLIDEL